VRQCAKKLVRAAGGRPILDVACGSGRNGLYLASFGCGVIFADYDLTPLHERARCAALKIDLARDPWPFGLATLGGIIDVHFLLPDLFRHFAASLAPEGCLLLETVSGYGSNYRELPKAGNLRQELAENFDFEQYRERAVGPVGCGAVTVRVLARRRAH
jgi:SAM-dependent methyltransferase